MAQGNPVQSILVFAGDMFRVHTGANRGKALSGKDNLRPDDLYLLQPGAVRGRLALNVQPDGGFCVAEGSELGIEGQEIALDCAIRLFSPEGHAIEAVVLRAASGDGAVFLSPLSGLCRETGYRLGAIDPQGARRVFARTACTTFTRGTRITLATGEQVPVEELKSGDRLLTRAGGGKKIRWVGPHSVLGTGDLAPIVIEAGTLNNENDLIVSPDHRLFVSRSAQGAGAGPCDLLVKARHLLNGETVYVRESGEIDYFQILFDSHHVVYAEGIAAEAALIDPRTHPALPSELLEKLSALMPRHGSRDDRGLDVQKALLDRPDAIELLRMASAV